VGTSKVKSSQERPEIGRSKECLQLRSRPSSKGRGDLLVYRGRVGEGMVSKEK